MVNCYSFELIIKCCDTHGTIWVGKRSSNDGNAYYAGKGKSHSIEDNYNKFHLIHWNSLTDTCIDVNCQ